MSSTQNTNDLTYSFQLVVKRILDVVIALATLLFISPLLLLVALVIKLETRGPVLARQVASYYSGRTVQIFQFRSDTATLKLTSLSDLLSRSGLDRLPMLANVLRGDMSIVGISFMNRNERPRSDEALVLRQTELKPGLLKWSRAFERPAPTARSQARVRIEDDLHYIANWSLLLDAKIILKALFAKSSYELDGEDGASRRVSISRS